MMQFFTMTTTMRCCCFFMTIALCIVLTAATGSELRHGTSTSTSTSTSAAKSDSVSLGFHRRDYSNTEGTALLVEDIVLDDDDDDNDNDDDDDVTSYDSIGSLNSKDPSRRPHINTALYNIGNGSKVYLRDNDNIHELSSHHDHDHGHDRVRGLSRDDTNPIASSSSRLKPNVYSCPPVGGAPIGVISGRIEVPPCKNLCTLTKIVTTIDGGGSTVPIARSYNNLPWEKSAGDFAASLFAKKDIVCRSGYCEMNLSPLNKIGRFKERYVLSTFDYSLTPSEEYARFLETATFGVTQEQLDAFGSSPDSVKDTIINWVSDQMDTSITPLTSHRAVWRKGANGRLPVTSRKVVASHPCDLYSKWRKLSFVESDKHSILQVVGKEPFQLKVNGRLRTVVDSLTVDDTDNVDHTFDDPNHRYIICGVEEELDGRLFLRIQNKCVPVKSNPVVNLDGFESSVSNIIDLPHSNLQPIDRWWTGRHIFIYRLDVSLFDDPSLSGTCLGLPSQPTIGGGPIFGRLSDGSWMIFDPRIELQTNTLDDPLGGGRALVIDANGVTQCSNVPRTFLNENECQLSLNGCEDNFKNSQLEIPLNNATIITLNDITERYVYAIKGLLVDYQGIKLEHPCTPGLRSRWEPKDISDCKPTELQTVTKNTLSQLLAGSTDVNPFLRDIFFPEEGATCSRKDKDPTIEIEVNGECWTRIHPDHMSIFDVTYWVDNHPGGPNKIQKWSENNGTILVYPSSLERYPHGMTSWNNYWHKFTLIGRFGDSLNIRDLPNELKTEDVIDYFIDTEESGTGNVLVCGSPFEVSNNNRQGFKFDAFVGLDAQKQYLTNTGDVPNRFNRNIIWIMIALSARDQLRQRVSWALSQIFVVVPEEISSTRSSSEPMLAYYDIFVRNAFGNFRDVLKEISYNPLMAQNLSYLASKSSAYMLNKYKVKISADENFAREIMQLFTMGLIKVNMDGSPKLDKDGNTQLAYTNDDIESLSRAWTGFDLQSQRGNVEVGKNEIDPMIINADWRDRFPKTDTTGGYIGDKYPLCSDFPSKSFLRKGAKFRLLGSSNLPELMDDPREFKIYKQLKRFVLDEASSLRSLLCNKSQTGVCNFKNIVTLETNLDCSTMECDVDTVRVVEVDADIFYEFVSPPCVTFPFYNNPVKISLHSREFPMMCADPKLPVAGAGCCRPNMNIDTAIIHSKYSGERMSFTMAQARCSVISENVCPKIDKMKGARFFLSRYFWNADSCGLQAKIRRDGSLTIVHDPTNSPQRVEHVSLGNQNFFKVYWEQGGKYPTVGNGCNGVCQVMSEGTCLCNTAVIEDAVFKRMPSGKNEIIEKLHVGAVDPRTFDIGTYFSTFNSSLKITVHLKDNVYNSETIFEYEDDEGQKRFLKNVRSSVYLLDTTGEYTGHSFRNAPQFMSFIPSETNLRDAQYETEAVLDHYFFHDNTAPFLAQRLIQRLVMSNPGPQYIQAVAEAFKTGSYVSGGISFGSGKYGDLASTFAAIYLDRAARNVLLDKDISNGALREPILKVTSLMRSMEYVSRAPIIELNTDTMYNNLGQVAYEFDTVFSFFSPEHKPFGRVGGATLVSPEATLLDMPRIAGLLNGLTSMIRFGLSNCGGGLSFSPKCKIPPHGHLQFNRTNYALQKDFSFETFEGPSLKGGFDHKWTGLTNDDHHGEITVDPFDDNNHVLYFPVIVAGIVRFYSPLIKNQASDGNPVVVKFRYLHLGPSYGACIGYGRSNTVLCDTKDTMQSHGKWISCQFVVPPEIESFKIGISHTRKSSGISYFDDIQIGSGDTTTCNGVHVPRHVPPGKKGYSNAVVDRLSLLLTAGRLGSKAKSIIVDAFDGAWTADNGLAIAQQIIVSTPEFHTTDSVKSTDEPRAKHVIKKATGKPYKAVIYLLLSGGCDSFNMLVPHTCKNNLYERYLDVRQQVAIEKERLLPISASDQVCSKYGVHPALPTMKNLYDDGDLLFFANTGHLLQPMTKDDFYKYAKTQSRLFAHNAMQDDAMTLDPDKVISGTGILGRMTDILDRNGHNIGSFSVGRNAPTTIGEPEKSGSPIVLARGTSLPRFHLYGLKDIISKLHNKTELGSGIFADSWSAAYMDSVPSAQVLLNALDTVTTSVQFPNTLLGDSFKTIARLIASREARGVDVDTFHVIAKRYDSHKKNNAQIDYNFKDVDSSLSAFVREMKAMDVWDSVTLMQMSEFGRTLSPNGNDGTDHAWGGNYMLMGGSVRGGQVLGKYPTDFTENGPLTLTRGRMIPSTPWEAPFQGIATWLGIDANDMAEVCPNLKKFNSSYLIDPAKMFDDVKSSSGPEIPRFPSSDASSIFASFITLAFSLAPLVLFL